MTNPDRPHPDHGGPTRTLSARSASLARAAAAILVAATATGCLGSREAAIFTHDAEAADPDDYDIVITHCAPNSETLWTPDGETVYAEAETVLLIEYTITNLDDKPRVFDVHTYGGPRDSDEVLIWDHDFQSLQPSESVSSRAVRGLNIDWKPELEVWELDDEFECRAEAWTSVFEQL